MSVGSNLANLREEVRALGEQAEGREFSPVERDRWNDLNAKVDELERREARLIDLASRDRNVEGEPPAASAFRSTVPQHLNETRSRALKTIERYEKDLTA